MSVPPALGLPFGLSLRESLSPHCQPVLCLSIPVGFVDDARQGVLCFSDEDSVLACTVLLGLSGVVFSAVLPTPAVDLGPEHIPGCHQSWELFSVPLSQWQ